MKYLVLAMLLLSGCASKPVNCTHLHLPDGSIMEFCGKAVQCSTSYDAKGSLKLCKVVIEKSQPDEEDNYPKHTYPKGK